ncbi:MAG: hypothetical protein SVN78_01300 [Deferribacterota bacterium]|nr:hypothetical protein [Deferribacterota bacterium]
MNNLTSILKYIIVYLISFLIFFILLYPYEIIITNFINKISESYNIPIQYSNINSSLFKSSIGELNILINDNIKINNINIKYSPFSIITNNFAIKADDKNLKLTGYLNNNNLKTDINLNINNANLQNVVWNGNLDIKSNINLKSYRGNVDIHSNKLALTISDKKINIDNIVFKSFVSNDQIEINNLKISGDLKASANGIIFINKNNLKYSSMNIRGTVTMDNQSKNIFVRGTFHNPTIITR